jgi:hypothetical protein
MRIQYYVIFYDGGWMIKRQGQFYGPYSSRQEAVREAVYVATHSIDHGLEAEVIVQKDEPEMLLGSRLA